MKFTQQVSLSVVLFFSISLQLLTPAYAGLLSEDTLQAIVSVLKAGAPEKKARARKVKEDYQTVMALRLESILENADLKGELIADVIECAMHAYYGKTYQGSLCKRPFLYNEIQNQLFKEAESNTSRERKNSKSKTAAPADSVVLVPEDELPFEIRTPRGVIKARSPAPPSVVHQVYQSKIPLFFENLTPQKFKGRHILDVTAREAYIKELEAKWSGKVEQKRAFLEKLAGKYQNASFTPETADAVLMDIKRAQTPELLAGVSSLDQSFAEELGSFPDSPTKEEEAEALTGSFIRRPKRVGDPGSYFTTFATTVRHAYEEKNLAVDAPIALKVMEVRKMKEMLNLQRKNRSKGIDRSIVAMILLNTRTDSIPQLYGMSLGGRVGSDGRKFLWTEVEWIPESLEQVLTSEEVLPEWMVLQVFYEEVLLRNLGVCIGDWKTKNVGFVTSQTPREISLNGRSFVLPPGRRFKRMDPGELHFLQATPGKRGKFSAQNLNVPAECKISLTGWKTPSDVLNEAIPFYVELLNEGNVFFLTDPKFLDLFKAYENESEL